MKKEKDIFNGNVIPSCKKTVIVTLILTSAGMIGLSIFFLLFALLYQKVDFVARIIFYMLSGFCFIFSILYPILTIYSARHYREHPKLAKAFLKSYVFVPLSEDNPNDNESNQQ